MLYQEIRRLLSDGVPRSTPMIAEALNVESSRVSSAISNMMRRDVLKASDLVVEVIPVQDERGRWRYRRRKMRFYVLSDGPDSAEVTIKTFDRKTNEVYERRVHVTFKGWSELSKRSGDVGARVLRCLERSALALFPEEIAERTGLKKAQVSSALATLFYRGKVSKGGYFDRIRGRQRRFSKGYLYYINSKQYVNRLKDSGLLLSRSKRRLFEEVKVNSKVHHVFTPLTYLAEKFGLHKLTVSEYMEDIMAVTGLINKVSVSKNLLYYFKPAFDEGSLEAQITYWEKRFSRERSKRGLMGRSHEEFIQLGITWMHEQGDLRLDNYFWEYRISGGVKHYNVFKPRFGDPKHQYEFDRILHAQFSTLSSRKHIREIIFIFESKYVQSPQLRHWQDFIRKIADTYDFGTSLTLPALGGGFAQVRIPKFNVVPVMFLSWPGRKTIQWGGRQINLAQLINLQGGMVLYTGEIERYLGEKLGHSVSFRRLFDDWFFKERERRTFAEYVLSVFSGCKSSPLKSDFIPEKRGV